jgi:hypothetical protein
MIVFIQLDFKHPLRKIKDLILQLNVKPNWIECFANSCNYDQLWAFDRIDHKIYAVKYLIRDD